MNPLIILGAFIGIMYAASAMGAGGASDRQDGIDNRTGVARAGDNPSGGVGIPGAVGVADWEITRHRMMHDFRTQNEARARASTARGQSGHAGKAGF